MYIPDQPKIPRIRWRTIGNYFLEVLNLERGIGYTTKKFVLDPHGAVYEYLFEDRRQMVKPVSFLLLMTGVTTFLLLRMFNHHPELSQGADLSSSYLSPKVVEVLNSQVVEIFTQYTNLLFMLAIPFVSIASYWVFHRRQLFFTEHLIINTYIYCIQSYLLLLLPLSINNAFISLGIMIAYFAYFVYAITRIFRLTFWSGLGYSILIVSISQIISTPASGLIIGILVMLN